MKCIACLAAGTLAAIGASAIASAQSGKSEPDVQPAQVIASMEADFGVHPGQRRNHTKGTCAAGQFVGTADTAKLSQSALFSGQPVQVVARFSIGGGNPDIADTARTVRGMALEFRLPGGNLQHMTMINTPMFAAAHPAVFNDALIAAKPDPKTGKPDPAKLHAFLASHPEAMAQAKYVERRNPPKNYFSSPYFGVHTFKFVDAKNVPHAVRWRFVPSKGEVLLTDAELKSAPHDFLERNLIAQTKQGPVQWDMVVYVGEPGDTEDNPTILWPESRKHFTAGTLTISEAMPQTGAPCEKINFDPLVMAEGIAPTSDPILLFRSPAYAISFSRRLTGK